MSLLEGEVRGGMEAEVEARTVPGRGEDEAKTGLRLGENGAKWSAGMRRSGRRRCEDGGGSMMRLVLRLDSGGASTVQSWLMAWGRLEADAE